jgi:heme oxygenase
MTTTTVMELLRDSTSDMHNSAEANEFQHKLSAAKVQKDELGRYLQQLYLIHQSISNLIEQSKTNNDALRHVVRDYHSDLTCIVNDIEYLGQKPELATPLKATADLVASMIETSKNQTAALLGYLYVLEGSTNGAKFLAKALRNGLELPVDAGASYFDRYGDKQRERWNEFKQAMNEVEFTEDERAKLVSTAAETFQTFGKIGDELLQNS